MRRIRARRLEALRWHRCAAIGLIPSIACMVLLLGMSLWGDAETARRVTPEGGSYTGSEILSFEKDDLSID